MTKFIEEYKGYKIYKCKQDSYMKQNNLHYMAYDEAGNLFDGAETLEEMKNKIFEEVCKEDLEDAVAQYHKDTSKNILRMIENNRKKREERQGANGNE